MHERMRAWQRVTRVFVRARVDVSLSIDRSIDGRRDVAIDSTRGRGCDEDDDDTDESCIVIVVIRPRRRLEDDDCAIGSFSGRANASGDGDGASDGPVCDDGGIAGVRASEIGKTRAGCRRRRRRRVRETRGERRAKTSTDARRKTRANARRSMMRCDGGGK